MVEKKEEKKTNEVSVLREGNISLILDSYDDLFSDFDPRHYGEKALSDDFLNECKKAAHDKRDHLELRLLAPKKKRNTAEENLIKKRLKDHFHRHYLEKKKELARIKLSGLMWFIFGTLVIIGGTFLYPYREQGFFFTLLFIISEPASWFFFWEGLSKIFITSKESMPDFLFYQKMFHSEIKFFSY